MYAPPLASQALYSEQNPSGVSSPRWPHQAQELVGLACDSTGLDRLPCDCLLSSPIGLAWLSLHRQRTNQKVVTGQAGLTFEGAPQQATLEPIELGQHTGLTQPA